MYIRPPWSSTFLSRFYFTIFLFDLVNVNAFIAWYVRVVTFIAVRAASCTPEVTLVSIHRSRSFRRFVRAVKTLKY